MASCTRRNTRRRISLSEGSACGVVTPFDQARSGGCAGHLSRLDVNDWNESIEKSRPRWALGEHRVPDVSHAISPGLGPEAPRRGQAAPNNGQQPS